MVKTLCAIGAVAVVAQVPCSLGKNFPFVQVADARRAMAQLAIALHGNPALRLFPIGITGTNGKTTISFMLREILKAAGRALTLAEGVDLAVDALDSGAARELLRKSGGVA